MAGTSAERQPPPPPPPFPKKGQLETGPTVDFPFFAALPLALPLAFLFFFAFADDDEPDPDDPDKPDPEPDPEPEPCPPAAMCCAKVLTRPFCLIRRTTYRVDVMMLGGVMRGECGRGRAWGRDKRKRGGREKRGGVRN